MELILGTAEFNPDGYAGKSCPDKKEIIRILNLAWEGGVRTLDCAFAYNCDTVLNNYAYPFRRINKSRNIYENTWYHYQQTELPIAGICNASVYTQAQLCPLQSAIVPMSINNVDFILRPPRVNAFYYARSVFDRGRLLKQGYTVKDCLSFVKRQRVDGVIVGVNKVKELEQILKAW